MFLSIQAFLCPPNDGKEAALHVSPSAPVAGMSCHSRAHAAAFVAAAAPDVLRSQEVVLVVPATVNQADFDALKKILSTKPMGYVELLSDADLVVMGEAPSGGPGKSRVAAPVQALHHGFGWSKNKDAWKPHASQMLGQAWTFLALGCQT
ncbi:unnamed protein product [Durusdinium trenchii]|uniref:Uncharacterized protein n=2 Tax=Durusdinium trenchii TaxID=1381693 RepID=A0ABP0PKC7_9DINO